MTFRWCHFHITPPHDIIWLDIYWWHYWDIIDYWETLLIHIEILRHIDDATHFHLLYYAIYFHYLMIRHWGRRCHCWWLFRHPYADIADAIGWLTWYIDDIDIDIIDIDTPHRAADIADIVLIDYIITTLLMTFITH